LHSPKNSTSNSTMDFGSSFDNTPEDLVLHMLSFLDINSITTVRLVSKQLKKLADDGKIWRYLCLQSWVIFSEESPKVTFHDLNKDWRRTFIRVEQLCRKGVWKGMSKWIEPKGFDHEQETTVNLEFPINTKDILGEGETINYNTPSEFKIEGKFTSSKKFTWSKKFSTHTSHYEGELDVDQEIMQGTIEYNDGRTQWKGVFLYQKRARCEES